MEDRATCTVTRTGAVGVDSLLALGLAGRVAGDDDDGVLRAVQAGPEHLRVFVR